MIAKHGRFVEYSVFGKETSVDWTVISDSKGDELHCLVEPLNGDTFGTWDKCPD